MSFRYLVPDGIYGLETRGTRNVTVQQCRRRVKVVIEQPDSDPERVVFTASLNEYGDFHVDEVNFGLTGGSPYDVVIADMEGTMSASGNFYGHGRLANPEFRTYNGSPVLFVFETTGE